MNRFAVLVLILVVTPAAAQETESARAAFAAGRYAQARSACQASEDRDVLLALLDGPFKARWPQASQALESLTPDGHYRIVTDLGLDPAKLDRLEAQLADTKKAPRLLTRARKGHKMLKQLSKTLDQAYKAYDKLFGLERSEEVVPTVYVLSSEEEFASFSARLGVGDTENTLGYYLRKYRVMVFYEPYGKYSRRLDDELLETLMHETFHQWLHLYVERAPRWFNEGLAEYFAFSKLNKSTLRYGLVPQSHPSRLSNIREGLAGLLTQTPYPLKTLLTADFETWNARSAMCYAQSWSFVHYLASSAPGRKVLRQVFTLLRAGTDASEVYEAVFGDVAVGSMEREWRGYVGRLR